MPESVPLVYFNGELVSAAAARLPIDDRGVLFGLGFFETFRTSGGRPHHWNYHRRRLTQACATAGLAIPPHFLAADSARLGATVAQLLASASSSDAVFRYTITAGTRAAPSEFLVLRPLPPAAPPEGISLRVLALARDNGEFIPRPKSLNYANALLGAGELARRTGGPADEGLFLSREGRCVVETPCQNIAWLAGGELRYPDPSLGAIAGTCLEWLRENCGLPAMPRRAPLDELLAADAILVGNAVRGITPVREIWSADDRTLLRSLDSAAHPRIRAFHAAWDDALRATAAKK
ncbi:MAG TPA: aminotransferase class IV [Opitutus sp.]|nr:aminotransferase class IV [Opitutus sp.]